MTQDDLFRAAEGNRWYERNRRSLSSGTRMDWPLRALSMLEGFAPASVLEVGCCDGYRLQALRRHYGSEIRCAGVDASVAACEAGIALHPELDLRHGLMSAIPFEEQFELVIVNFVLHWVDRATLAQSIAGVDAAVADGGILVIGDFLPDHQQRRRYHHLPEEDVWTWKQDYTLAFAGLGTYREVLRLTFDHDHPERAIGPASSESRAFCAILEKSLAGYYPEVKA